MIEEEFIKELKDSYNSLTRKATIEEKSFEEGYTYAVNRMFYLIKELQEENEKLESILKLREDVITTQHNKIDKIIEYLKLFDRDSDMINHSIIRGALNILQGDDNK